MVFERGVLIEALAPRGWLVLAGVAIAVAVFVALLVLLLVSGSDFRQPAGSQPVTPGSCYPFCTDGNTPVTPPPPGWN
ncbi:hypothetical protein IU500_08705 [Nocardia terpenica]|uniref:Uncharacterized protein n=1 Tax=Nocardia terpenica TaxID=455432 RepID=A0A161XDP4_9NOCA|nr:hypothetical protein [Nocardia terpenica]ATL70346.1 hypothetical protein CRH09_33370 [Nocardia terpenica]KZM71418.1 hypothetical protein AWN90_01245 [Nocardia terpenica]MBF6060858.1 hypothetical protein [Nocardia terpenica]MBF6104118.1 hypothetical protein [Nocardia terpenica]MBF6111508.1 hypothetical protein [Nocardia terpenica]